MIDTAGGSTSASVGDGAIPPSPAPNVVHLAERCPGSPHAFDVVTLRKVVTNRMGIAVAAVRVRATNAVDAEADLGMVFLRYGIEAWTFPDPITEPVAVELIERWLPYADGGYTVAEAANSLYAEDVFRPFLPRPLTRSPVTAGARTTSAKTRSGGSRRTRSKPSSRTVTAGKRSSG